MYMDLVLALHYDYQKNEKKYLYQAPGFSGLKEGDEIIAYTDEETATIGKHRSVVLSCITINTNVEENAYRMILDIAGAEEPLKKVLAKIERKPFIYTEE